MVFYLPMTCFSELLKSQEVSINMKSMMEQYEKERKELQEARRRAEEARILAEETVNVEKVEYERRVCIDVIPACHCTVKHAEFR
jgi:hypothetical protein